MSEQPGRGRHPTPNRRPAPLPLAALALGACLALGAAARAAAPALAAPLTPAYVCAADLEAALTARSDALASRAADVERRAEELRVAELGLAASVTLGTGLELGQNLARPGTAPAWSPELELDASLGYVHDEVARARARANLLQAQARHAAQARTEALQALLAFSRLRVAARAAAQAEVAAAEAEALAASVRASAAVAAGDAADVRLDVRELELAARRARATAQARHAEATAILEQLERAGVTPVRGDGAATQAGPAGTATCLSALLADGLGTLPPPRLPAPARTAAERRLLAGAVELAAAQLRRARFDPLRDVSLTGRYQADGSRLTAELALDTGRPAAGVAYRWRDVATHGWSVGVSATFRLDTSLGAALDAARARLASAQAELDAFDAAFPERVSGETAAVLAAWQELEFAAEALAIARERLALAADERATARAEQVAARSVDALERAYQAYLRALGRYLDAFDLPWSALAGPG